MVELTDIHSLTDFNRNTKEHLHRLKKTGKPEVLTVNGRAQIVVQSAVAYQKLLQRVRQADLLDTLSASLEEARTGKGRPARTVLAELAEQAGFTLKK